MVEKLFITGLPGSGKSALARYIESYVTEKSWTSRRFNDYDILDAMFHNSIEGQLFEHAGDTGGFNVLDIRAFDTALQRLEPEITDYLSTRAKAKEVIIIEFARNDYWRAFRQFSRPFLQDAFFINLSVKIDVCKERINERVANPMCADDYPISEYIFKSYYHSDDGAEIALNLRDVFGVSEERVLKFDNNHTLQMAIKKIAPFIDLVLNHTAIHRDVESPQNFSLASMPD